MTLKHLITGKQRGILNFHAVDGEGVGWERDAVRPLALLPDALAEREAVANKF